METKDCYDVVLIKGTVLVYSLKILKYEILLNWNKKNQQQKQYILPLTTDKQKELLY